jgi:Fic family protein
MTYNWQQADWGQFHFSTNTIEAMLFAIAEETGRVSGLLVGLPDDIKTETFIDIMVAEAMKTSAIEGEYLSMPDVMSSIKNKLGLNQRKENIKDKKSGGAGALMVAVRTTYLEPLTAAMLFSWHRMLMEHSTKIKAGEWRKHKAPMQVVSGAIGKEKVHFEAPPSNRVAAEMDRFIQWFNSTAPGGEYEIKHASVRAAIAHLYFESIHPFEDGNGRIGRAIAEKALSQTIGRPIMLSLSQVIESNKKNYYKALEKAQRKNEITEWLEYFVDVVYKAQIVANTLIRFTLQKSMFIDKYKNRLNDRQMKVLLKMLESPNGFEGGMSAKKYISITKTSKATATRDLQQLIEIGALLSKSGGRSTHYHVCI